MNIAHDIERDLLAAVEERKDRLISIAQQLVRTRSENTPPTGAEEGCQRWMAEQLQFAGLNPTLYYVDDVRGLRQHPLFHGLRDYSNRPNLEVRVKGSGNGRSLLLSGHIDTVPGGTQEWTADPFSGIVADKRLFGRGSNDMKAGIAMNLFVVECLQSMGVKLSGDLLFESVIDEEFGGCNGTLAGRVRGFNADAAVLSEPSSLRICAAQRGGRTAHITFRAPGGVLHNGRLPSGVTPQLTAFLNAVPRFAEQRRAQVKPHAMYASQSDPVPVTVTKIHTAPWGFREPITVPEMARVELYWQLMPGEQQKDVEAEFFQWLEALVTGAPDLFNGMPEVTFPIRWMPGSSISASEPLVEELSDCARTVTGKQVPVTGIEGPCDLFIFQDVFGIPAVLWGPSGGNTHAADEYVDIDSLIVAAKTLMLFTSRWCGVSSS
jgi:acetylornithine deacetylase